MMAQIRRLTPDTAAALFTHLLQRRGAADMLPEAYRDGAVRQLHGHLLAIFQGLEADATFLASDIARSRLYHSMMQAAPRPNPAPPGVPMPAQVSARAGVVTHPAHAVPVQAPVMPYPVQTEAGNGQNPDFPAGLTAAPADPAALG